MQAVQHEWVRVSKNRPCDACGKGDWCTFTDGGRLACCMRVQSDQPMKNGGWAHRFGEPQRAYAPPPPRPPDPKPTIDFQPTWSAWRERTPWSEIERLAHDLGVSPASLQALGAAWAPPHSAWAFPMFDAERQVVGIRLRSADGQKWAVRGSRQGLFIPEGEPPSLTLVCEGPTDTAAAMSLGYYAIGRPSCAGHILETARACRALGIRRVIVMSDSDDAGRLGAHQLVLGLRLPFKLAFPPAKDLRAWVQAGATRKVVDSVLDQVMWRFADGR